MEITDFHKLKDDTDNNNTCPPGKEDEDVEIRKWELSREILAVLGPLLLMVGYGTVDGYSAILLHQIEDPRSTIRVDMSQASWIASSTPLVICVGCFLSGWFMERFGRKRVIILVTPLDVCGWCLLYFGTSFEHLVFARFLNGLCIGLCCPACLCYVGEVCLPRYRELLLSSFFFEIALGTFLTNLMGTFLSWRMTALYIMVIPIAGWVLMLRLPESHVWGADMTAFNELLESRRGITKTPSTRELLAETCKPEFLKPLSITVVMFLTAQITGHNAVVYYSLSIMKSSIKGLNEYVAMLTVDVFRVVMAVLACVLVKRFNVRGMVLMGGLGTALSLFALSGLIFLANTYPTNELLSVAPIVPFITDAIFISLGLLPMKWAVCGQIFPAHTRGLGNGLSTSVNFLAIFIIVKTSPGMTAALGMAASFALYATLTLCGTSILYMILPKTKEAPDDKDVEGLIVRKVDSGRTQS